MSSHVAQVGALLAEADKLPDCTTKFDLLDEAIRVADMHRDVRLGVAARLPFLHVARNLLRGDQMAVAFLWCLHQYDQTPELFAGRDLLDDYAELIGQLANFDCITRAQLDALLADLTDRTVREGRSLAPVWSMKREMAPDLGDRELSREAIRQLEKLRREWRLTPANLFYHAQFVGDEDEALRIADAEWLGPGRAAPARSVWYKALLMLLKRGRWDDLRRCQNRAVAGVTGSEVYHWDHGAIVATLALSGRIADAVKLCGKCQRALREFADPLTRLHFHSYMVVLFDRLHALGTESVLVRFTQAVPGRKPNGRYVVAEVRDWMWGQATGLAARFDARNGTDYYAEQLRERTEWQQFARPAEGP